jgi:hypothetical protein
MTGVFGQRVMLGQGNGPDVELVVEGDEWYANYETPSGYSVIYDDDLGLFAYARVRAGCFESTQVPATQPPPPGIEPHARESDEIRVAKVGDLERTRGGRQRERKQP